MYLLDLPGELLALILDGNTGYGNTLNIHDYSRLSITNKRLHELVSPLLHRRLKIKLGAYVRDPPSKTEAFARNRLLKDPELSSYIRKLNIELAHGQVDYGEDMSLEILRVAHKVEKIGLGWGLKSKPFIDQVTILLCSGSYRNLRTLTLSGTICICQIRPFFSIRGLQSLSTGYYSSYSEEGCTGDHSALRNPGRQAIGASSVSYLSISTWQPTPSLSCLLSLPNRLLGFKGRWAPEGSRCSPLSVSKFFFPHKDTLEKLDLAASIDKLDEYEPQSVDGTYADFADFTALRHLKVDLDVVLPEYLSGPGVEDFAKRLPPQLKTLTVRNLPRFISTYAHRSNTAGTMEHFDEKLAFVRSLAREAHQYQHLSSLRSITLHETSDLPGPLEGPYLSPIFKPMQWRSDEKEMWCERGPYPLSEVGMNLTIHLSFIVRGWIHRPKGSKRMKKLLAKETRRIEELEAGINTKHGDDGEDDDEDGFETEIENEVENDD